MPAHLFQQRKDAAVLGARVTPPLEQPAHSKVGALLARLHTTATQTPDNAFGERIELHTPSKLREVGSKMGDAFIGHAHAARL